MEFRDPGLGDDQQLITAAAIEGLKALAEAETTHPKGGQISMGMSPAVLETMDVAVRAERQEGIGAGGGMDAKDNSPKGGVTAFKIVWDVEKQCYKVHDPRVALPDGSVNVPECADLTNEMDVYLHVWKKADGAYQTFVGGENGVTVEETDQWHRKYLIAKIGADAPDCVTQVHTGVFTVNDSVAAEMVPGNFEPYFKDGKLYHVGEGYCPIGRRFALVQETSVENVIEAMVWLQVTHSTSNQNATVAVMVGVDPDFNNTDTTKTNIPLYRVAGGAMTKDYRSCMSLMLRE